MFLASPENLRPEYDAASSDLKNGQALIGAGGLAAMKCTDISTVALPIPWWLAHRSESDMVILLQGSNTSATEQVVQYLLV